MTTEDLTAKVMRRVNAYQSGDPGPALDLEALTEAAALLDATGERGERGMKGLYAVAWLHWIRYLALPHDQRAKELSTARRLFEPFREYDPGKVPSALRREAGFDDDGATDRIDALMRALRDAVVQKDEATLGPLIDDVVELLHETPAGRNGTRGLWTVLAMAYRQKYVQDKGGPHLLFLMVDAARKGATMPNRADYPASLDMLAVALNFRYSRTGDLDDVDELIDTIRRRLALIPADETAGARPRRLFQLAEAFSDRFDPPATHPDVTDSDVALLRAAVQLTPPGDQERPLRLAATGRVLRELYERTGSEPYLHESVDALRAAATEARPSDRRRHRYLLEVATSLRLRHTDLGNPADLNEAIDALRAAAQGMSPTVRVYNAGRNPPTASEVWYRIADALNARAAHATDLNEALAALGAALNATPPDSPPQPGKPSHADMQRLYAQAFHRRQQIH